MFRSPEHCLSFAFTFAELRIEPRNATAVVIESIRARAGAHAQTDVRPPSGLSQHDWHAQAAMVLSFTERTLSPHPLLWQAVLAEYCHDVRGALGVQAVGDALAEGLSGRDRLLADMLILRAFRGRPRLRDIADRFDVSVPTASRAARQWHEPVARLRARAISELLPAMTEAELLTPALTA